LDHLAQEEDKGRDLGTGLMNIGAYMKYWEFLD
jgi:hypothetical protein